MGNIIIPENRDYMADAVVIGGGAIGVATAFWLSRYGLKTVLLEAREELAGLTTAASAECFRAQFTEDAIAPIAIEAIDIFENFAEFIGIPGYDIHVRQQGYLFLTDDKTMLPQLEAAVAQYHKLKVTDAEFLDAAQARKRFPFVSSSVVGATFRQRDGWMACHEMVHGLAKAAGARFFIKTRVTDVLTDADGVCGVQTDRGLFHTRVVVNAAGPFAGVIGKMAGIDLPLEPVRRQKAYIKTDAAPADAPFTVDLINGSYWRPESGGAIVGWVDPDEPVSEPLEYPQGDWDFPAYALDHASRLTPFWENVIADMKQEDVDVSAGQYVYTPDTQPLIGPVPGLKGFYLNCGYWMGVMVSPVAGRMTADLITGKMDNKKNPLRLTRFEEGAAIQGGAFLRGH